jgi:AAA domain
MNDSPPLEAYADDLRANGTSQHLPKNIGPNEQAGPIGTTSPAPKRSPISWDSLEGRDPPAREWIIPHWIPAGHMTLLAGRGGIGKTLLAQHIATAISLGHEYMEPLEARRVLMWAGEDDEAELWRRQVQISSWIGQPLSALTERFYLHSYAGSDITLMAPVYGALTTTPMLTELREQVSDYRPGVVILDNVARLFGGSENDRHQATTFCAVVQGVCAPAAVLLLGHPAKAAGSEYSGSTAWEGAVRARLYLSDRPPDQDPEDDEAPIDDTVRYLSRRKANYSARDIRQFRMSDGVLIPAAAEPARVVMPAGEFTKDIVRRAVRTLAARDIHGTASTASSVYLPRLARQYKLLETAAEKSFAAAMRQMILDGELVSQVVGRDSGRHAKHGLVIP